MIRPGRARHGRYGWTVEQYLAYQRLMSDVASVTDRAPEIPPVVSGENVATGHPTACPDQVVPDVVDQIAAASAHRHRCLRCRQEFDCLTPGICVAQFDVFPTIVRPDGTTFEHCAKCGTTYATTGADLVVCDRAKGHGGSHEGWRASPGGTARWCWFTYAESGGDR